MHAVLDGLQQSCVPPRGKALWNQVLDGLAFNRRDRYHDHRVGLKNEIGRLVCGNGFLLAPMPDLPQHRERVGTEMITAFDAPDLIGIRSLHDRADRKSTRLNSSHV